MKKVGIVFLVIALLIASTGCDVINPKPALSEATAHVMTLYAVLTESAHNNSIPTATPTQLPTQIPATATNAPQPTLTPVTELPTVTPPPTTQPIPCYRIGWVKDMTIPDNYDQLAPGVEFVKTWRLENGGSCNWPATVQLVFVSGEQMSGPNSQSIDATVGVGQYIDVSVTLTAPATTGKHTGYWMLKSPDGTRFGLGGGAETFWVMIQMNGGTVTPSITPTVGTPLPTKTPTLSPTRTVTRTPSPTITPSITATCVGGYPVC
jgi:hypothetical protein